MKIVWQETTSGWRANAPGGMLLMVNRARRGGGYVWAMHAVLADDDAAGTALTDVSGKYIAEKTYRAWCANWMNRKLP